MTRKSRLPLGLSKKQRWRIATVNSLEGQPVDVTDLLLLRKTETGFKPVVVARRQRFLSRSGAAKVAGVIEQTVDEYFRKHPIPKLRKVVK
jgi:hypothetical protein